MFQLWLIQPSKSSFLSFVTFLLVWISSCENPCATSPGNWKVEYSYDSSETVNNFAQFNQQSTKMPATCLIVMSCSCWCRYASAFYGPFREALDSNPRFGDKKT